MKNIQSIIFTTLLCLISQIKAQNPCAGQWTGRAPDPSDCNKYFNCVLTIAVSNSCNSNQIFDAATLTCIRGDPATCEPYVETTSTSFSNTTFTSTTSTFPINTTTTTPRSTTPPPNIEEICRNVFFGARPHPTSTTLYVGCIRGDGTIFQCFTDEFFDTRINECKEVCRVPANICESFKIELLINPCDCSRFIVCYNEAILEDVQCGPNEIFSVGDKE